MKIVMYTTSWCPDCHRSKRLLDEMGLRYAEIDIEEVDGAAEAMRRLNGGSPKVPTVLVESTVLVEPSDEALRSAVEAVRGASPTAAV